MKINESIKVEQVVNAPVQRVWKAITDADEMRQWYFDMTEFKPEPGFGFQFYGGDETQQWLHLCKITEATPPVKLAYTWKYETFDSVSLVCFTLAEEGFGQTRVTLTHEGVELFPQVSPLFSRESFEAGWDYIIRTSLKDFVENHK